MDRWATFDCYGTLIDWDAGIGRELERLFGAGDAPALLARYHEVEPEIQREQPDATYREVLAEALRRLGAPRGEEEALGRSLPAWEPFPEVRPALEDARARGWRLAILSNTDRDYLEASMKRIGVTFDLTVVASEIGSYKPAHGHWRAFAAEVGRPPDVHVGASLFHDIVPANELGLRSVWINRLGEEAGPRPTRELADLEPLPRVLEELAAA
jgi:2-haloacid dehalogenase